MLGKQNVVVINLMIRFGDSFHLYFQCSCDGNDAPPVHHDSVLLEEKAPE